MGKSLRILFITHESTLSGAPNLLLNLVQLLKKQGNCDATIVIKRGGVQDERFRQLGPTILLKPAGYQEHKSLPFKILDFIRYRMQLGKLMRVAKGCDLIFSNTIANGRLLRDLSVTGKPMVVYVHELHSAMEFCNRHHDTDLSLQLGARFFSPSNAVTLNLMERKVPKQKILPLNYYFPFDQKSLPADNQELNESFFSLHQINPHAFHVVGMGAAVERKGIDLFVEVCKLVCEKSNKVHFTWIGGFMDEMFREKVEATIENYQLKDRINITGYIPHAYENLRPFDLFILTSREDPYPLVVLEAAYAGLPSVAFKDTGGIEEFIGNDAGFLVEKLSIASMADQIIALSEDAKTLQEKAAVAKSRVIKWHHSDDLIFQQLKNGLEGLT